MSNPTTPFSWQMPTNTDLVTDLPADFEVFGQAVATSMQDLLGGTTGQVLAKASNADMDFVWSADAAGMTNPMTTTGDVIYSSPGSTPVRLGIGTTGQVLTVASGIPSWATPAAAGMTLISTINPSAVGTVNANNVFSSTYNSYYISFYVTQSANASITMRLRNAGTDETGSTYTLNGVVGGLGAGSSSWGLGPNVAVNNRYVGNIWVNKPFLAQATDGWYLMGYSAGGTSGAYAMFNSVTSSFDGFSIIQGSGTFTGQICVYGLVI